MLRCCTSKNNRKSSPTSSCRPLSNKIDFISFGFSNLKIFAFPYLGLKERKVKERKKGRRGCRRRHGRYHRPHHGRSLRARYRPWYRGAICGSVHVPGRLEPRRYLGRYPGRRLRPPLPARAPQASPRCSTMAGSSGPSWPVPPASPSQPTAPPTGRKIGPAI
jgi:hypothetical protein